MEDLGYWGRPVDLGWAGTSSITYSMPIQDGDGTVVGVLGVEVRLDRVTDFMPYRELDDEGTGSYISGRDERGRRLRARRRRDARGRIDSHLRGARDDRRVPKPLRGGRGHRRRARRARLSARAAGQRGGWRQGGRRRHERDHALRQHVAVRFRALDPHGAGVPRRAVLFVHRARAQPARGLRCLVARRHRDRGPGRLDILLPPAPPHGGGAFGPARAAHRVRFDRHRRDRRAFGRHSDALAPEVACSSIAPLADPRTVRPHDRCVRIQRRNRCRHLHRRVLHDAFAAQTPRSSHGIAARRHDRHGDTARRVQPLVGGVLGKRGGRGSLALPAVRPRTDLLGASRHHGEQGAEPACSASSRT